MGFGCGNYPCLPSVWMGGGQTVSNQGSYQETVG